jgi:hypothetical protein
MRDAMPTQLAIRFCGADAIATLGIRALIGTTSVMQGVCI